MYEAYGWPVHLLLIIIMFSDEFAGFESMGLEDRCVGFACQGHKLILNNRLLVCCAWSCEEFTLFLTNYSFNCFRFSIQYDYGEKSSWIGLPPSMAGRLLSQGTLPLTFRLQLYAGPGVPIGSPRFLAWSGGVSEMGKVSISSRLGTILHLPEGAPVALVPMEGLQEATSVIVEPASADDWEVVEMNAQMLEDSLLAQCGVVSMHSPLAVWIQGQIIALNVSKIDPEGDAARLVAGTEVAIAPRVRQNERMIHANDEAEVLRPLFLRVAILDPMEKNNASYKAQGDEEDGPRVFMSSATFHKAQHFIPILRGNGIIGIKASGKFKSEILARLVILDPLPVGHIVFHPAMSNLLRRYAIRVFQSVQIRCLGTESFPSLYLESYLKRQDSLAVPFSNSRAVQAAHMDDIQAMPCDEQILKRCLENILPVLRSDTRSLLQYWGAPRRGSMLLEGPQGSGKTAVVKSLCSLLQNNTTTLSAVKYIYCKDLVSAKAFFSTLSFLSTWATRYAPSIVVLDDLDVSLTEPAQDEEGHEINPDPDVVQLVRVLSETLDGLTRSCDTWLPSGHPGAGRQGTGSWPAICFIATCKQATKLPKELRKVGRFDTIISLNPPNASSRLAMLESSLQTKEASVSQEDLVPLSAEIDGFDLSDIETLVERTITQSIRRILGDSASSLNGSSVIPMPLPITLDDLRTAVHGMVPAAMWGSGTKKTIQSGIEGWKDVGGMDPARQALEESLELPLRYPKLIATAPLRLRTGALLYGPPGCGKTHIVAAAVAAADVRCILVNGPELLNKYIGASEAAVRDVFQRAATAAPSVLFFDEFDAIAPKRGHDNTGVSDRVVNQLLTELDGVEGLKGVVVVAATSRPDLIDTALLRPGRLDRMLFCGFPSCMERVEILQALSRKLKLSDDVNLENLGWETEGFSGADLGALLSEAQLIAAHEALQKQEHEGGVESLVLTAKHIQTALKDARPSVSMEERQRLERIYGRFREGSIETPSDAIGQRVTCA